MAYTLKIDFLHIFHFFVIQWYHSWQCPLSLVDHKTLVYWYLQHVVTNTGIPCEVYNHQHLLFLSESMQSKKTVNSTVKDKRQSTGTPFTFNRCLMTALRLFNNIVSYTRIWFVNFPELYIISSLQTSLNHPFVLENKKQILCFRCETVLCIFLQILKDSYPSIFAWHDQCTHVYPSDFPLWLQIQCLISWQIWFQ